MVLNKAHINIGSYLLLSINYIYYAIYLTNSNLPTFSYCIYNSFT
jgi:hypothetical protein